MSDQLAQYLRELEEGIATVEASTPTPEELDRLTVAMTSRLIALRLAARGDGHDEPEAGAVPGRDHA